MGCSASGAERSGAVEAVQMANLLQTGSLKLLSLTWQWEGVYHGTLLLRCIMVLPQVFQYFSGFPSYSAMDLSTYYVSGHRGVDWMHTRPREERCDAGAPAQMPGAWQQAAAIGLFGIECQTLSNYFARLLRKRSITPLLLRCNGASRPRVV